MMDLDKIERDFSTLADNRMVAVVTFWVCGLGLEVWHGGADQS